MFDKLNLTAEFRPRKGTGASCPRNCLPVAHRFSTAEGVVHSRPPAPREFCAREGKATKTARRSGELRFEPEIEICKNANESAVFMYFFRH